MNEGGYRGKNQEVNKEIPPTTPTSLDCIML